MAAVLVVDDDADTREALVRYLRKAGFVAECSASGRDALASVLAHPPDVLIVDLFMPEMDGTHFVEVIRSYLRVHAIPVIMYTGAHDGHPRLEAARGLKVSDVLVKAKSTFEDARRAVDRALKAVMPQQQSGVSPTMYPDDYV
jgi:CheY-like chemotaxis protein